MKVYIASPLGFSEITRLVYKEIVKELEKLDIEVVDPWQLTDQSLINKCLNEKDLNVQKKLWEETNLIIGKNNETGLKSCDLVLAILDGVDVDSGTSAEVGFAYAWGKKVIGYRGDFRLASDNIGSKVNLQVQYFVDASGGTIFNTVEEVLRFFGADY